jgi:hypothetical protein
MHGNRGFFQVAAGGNTSSAAVMGTVNPIGRINSLFVSCRKKMLLLSLIFYTTFAEVIHFQ